MRLAPGLEGQTSEGEGLGGERPVPQNQRCLEDAVPGIAEKIGSRAFAEAKVLRSSFLCLGVRTPIGADGFLRPERYVALPRATRPTSPATTTAPARMRSMEGIATDGNSRAGRLGHQSSCDCRNTHNDDEELERRGVAAIWFDVVNRHKQHGGNIADDEDVQHSDVPVPHRATGFTRTRWGSPTPKAVRVGQ